MWRPFRLCLLRLVLPVGVAVAVPNTTGAGWPIDARFDLLGEVPCLGDELYRPVARVCTTVAPNATPAATQCLAYCDSLSQGMARCMGVEVDSSGSPGNCCLLDRDWTWAESGRASQLLGGATLVGKVVKYWGTHLVRVQDDPRQLSLVQYPTACYRRRVDCSAAPNCTSLHRYPCEWGKVANMCDSCRPRYWRPGEPRRAAGNSQCVQDPAATPPTLRIAFSTSTLTKENGGSDSFDGLQAAYVGTAVAIKRAWEMGSEVLPIPLAQRQSFGIEFVGFSENWTKILSLDMNGTGEATPGSVMPGLVAMIGSSDSVLQRDLQLRQTSPPGRQVHALLGNVDNKEAEVDLAAAGNTYHTPVIGFKWPLPEFSSYAYYVRSNRAVLEAGTVIGNIFKHLGLIRIFVFEQIAAPRLASQIRVTHPRANVATDGPDESARGPFISAKDENAVKEVYNAWVRLRAQDARIIAHEYAGDPFENIIPLATDILGPKVLYVQTGTNDCELRDLLTYLANVQYAYFSMDRWYAATNWQGPRCSICRNIAIGHLDATQLANRTFTAEYLYDETTGLAPQQVAACPQFPTIQSFRACGYCDTEFGFFASQACWDLLHQYDVSYARSMCVYATNDENSAFVSSMLNFLAEVGDELPDQSDNWTADGLRAVDRLRAAGMPPSYLEQFEPGGHFWELGMQSYYQTPVTWTDAWQNPILLESVGRKFFPGTDALTIQDAILTLLVGYNEFVKYGGDADEESQAWWPSASTPNSYGFLRYLLGVHFRGQSGTVEYTLSGDRNTPYVVNQLIRGSAGGCFCNIRLRNATAGSAETSYRIEHVSAAWNFASAPSQVNLSAPLVLDDTNLYGCDAFSPGSLAGKIVLVSRGRCVFAPKVMNSQAAGAVAIIIWNRVSDNPLRAYAQDPSLVIPGVTIGNSDGAALAKSLRAGLQGWVVFMGSTKCLDPLYKATAGFENFERTMTFDLKTQKLTILAGQISFNDGTTTPPLEMHRPCLAGEAYNWSSRECEACAPGAYLPAYTALACLACPPGAFTNASGSAGCQLCPLGRFSPGGSASCLACEVGTVAPVLGSPSCAPCHRGQYWAAGSCWACVPGHFQENKAATACDLCSPGQFVEEPERSACSGCWPGSYQGAVGSTACVPCNNTAYQPAGSSLDCLLCEAVLPGSVASRVGALTAQECQCPQGRYFSRPTRNASAECAQCPHGLTCPGGLRPDGTCCEPPTQNIGLHVGSPEFPGGPFTFMVYCADYTKCPAGRALGACPPHAAGRACDGCEPSYIYSRKRGGCVACKGALAFWPLSLTIIVVVFLLATMVVLAVQRFSVQSTTLVTIALTTALCANMLQVLGAFRLLQLSWPEPLSTLYSALEVFSFNMELLNPACIFGSASPDVTYTGAILAHPVFAVVLTLVFVAVAVLSRRRVCAAQIANTQGVVVLSLYVSMCMVSVKPWQCKENPDGTFSVVSFRIVQCWVPGHHYTMLGLSACGILIYGVTFIALVAWATYVYPIRITQPGGFNFHRYFRFLFDRFKPNCYPYGLFYCVRNLLLAIIPVVLVNELSAQVMSTAIVVMGATLLQCWVKPWRTPTPNVFDACSALVLMLILLGGTVLADGIGDSDQAVVQAFFIFILTASVLLFVATTLYHAYFFLRPRRRYGIFLSHHKLGAAVLSRWFKLHLACLTKDEIFYDSDNLHHLDVLFQVCAHQTKNLVLLLTRETLRRIWCAGELVSAQQQHVPVVLVACNDYVPPSDDFIDALDGEWTTMQKLEVARLGISIQEIKDVYRGLTSKPIVQLDRTSRLDAQRQVVGEVFSRCKGLGLTAIGLMGMVGIGLGQVGPQASAVGGAPVVLYGDVKEPEDRMVGAVIAILLQMQIGISVLVVESAAEVFQDDLQGAHYFIVPLARGVLDSPAAGAVVARAARRGGVELLPLNFDPSFTFPGPAWYEDLLAGRVYPPDDVQLRGTSLGRVRASYAKLFGALSLRFTPHGSETLQKIEVAEMAPRFRRALAKRPSQQLQGGGVVALASDDVTAVPSNMVGKGSGSGDPPTDLGDTYLSEAEAATDHRMAQRLHLPPGITVRQEQPIVDIDVTFNGAGHI